VSLPLLSSYTRAVHEAGHIVVSRAYGVAVRGASIEQVGVERWGYTLTGKPEPTHDALSQACTGLTRLEIFRACQVYAQIALGGSAAELVDQKARGCALVSPTPCTDSSAAKSYLRFATTHGRLASDALSVELRRSEQVVRRMFREWRALVHALQVRARLDENEILAVLDECRVVDRRSGEP
jgi:hypothetical protein